MMFKEEETTKIVEPFNDGEEIEISYQPSTAKAQMRIRKPVGLQSRALNDQIEARDIAFYEWILNQHTDQEFMELAESESYPNERLVYMIQTVIGEITDTEIESWGEVQESSSSFIEAGNLGVQ